MNKFWMPAAALALTSGFAYAQTADEPEAPNGIGTEVRVLANGQRDAETKGIGAEVSALAKAQAAARAEAREPSDEETMTDDDADEPEAAETVVGRANAAPNSAAASAALVAEARGDNRSIKSGTGAVADLRNERAAAAAARESSGEARETAAAARAAAADVRANAADARANAAAVREQALAVRDAVRAARPGRGN